MIEPVPEIRINLKNEKAINTNGSFVIYWMVANRRLKWNYSLQHAIYLAQKNGVGLIILDGLRLGYPWASERIHRFVIEGMYDNWLASQNHSIQYYPYVERNKGEGSGLLEALSRNAVAVVSDEFPCFFIPRMHEAVSLKLECSFQLVDSNGILPLRAGGRVFTTAASFRRHLQKNILPHMIQWPVEMPLNESLNRCQIPSDIIGQWPTPDLSEIDSILDGLKFERDVPPVPFLGGTVEAEKQMTVFFEDRHLRYHSDRNQIDRGSASGLSPYFHFGHLSTHEFVHKALELSKWSADKVAAKPSGSRSGWWGLAEHTESLLDEVITWRELGYIFCYERIDDYDQYESLPDWAQKTLDIHSEDERPIVYSFEQLETAQTHDPLWNAAQRQLMQEGRIHNYLRMLWAKKILEWTESPKDALKYLIELNNKWAIDGRNPNSYSGIFWTLGRFDRAWGPERKIFGKIRYMASKNTAKKINVKNYLLRFGELK